MIKTTTHTHTHKHRGKGIVNDVKGFFTEKVIPTFVPTFEQKKYHDSLKHSANLKKVRLKLVDIGNRLMAIIISFNSKQKIDKDARVRRAKYIKDTIDMAKGINSSGNAEIDKSLQDVINTLILYEEKNKITNEKPTDKTVTKSKKPTDKTVTKSKKPTSKTVTKSKKPTK